MAPRSDALIPLSHDHHHVLSQARRLVGAAQIQDLGDRRRAADDFVNFYLGRVLRHVREEEELFLPPVAGADEGRELVIRAVLEHLELHGLVRSLKRQLVDGEAEPDQLLRLSELLTKHVRFEEQQLFPLIERTIPPDELEDLAVAGRRDV